MEFVLLWVALIFVSAAVVVSFFMSPRDGVTRGLLVLLAMLLTTTLLVML